MENVKTLEAAKDWFLSHSGGSVLCTKEGGEEKECNLFIDAQAFYGEATLEEAPKVALSEEAVEPAEEVQTAETSGEEAPAESGEAEVVSEDTVTAAPAGEEVEKEA